MLHLTTLLSTRGSQVLAGLGAVALLLVGVSGCGGGSSADHPAVQPTPTLGPIAATVSLPPRSSAPMALYDSTLVWVGAGRNAGSCPRFRVYRADLRRFQPRVLWTGPPCWSVSDIRISRSWIVWMAGEDPAGSIWAMHRWGGRRYPIAQQHFQPWQHPCLDLSCTPVLRSRSTATFWSGATSSSAGNPIPSPPAFAPGSCRSGTFAHSSKATSPVRCRSTRRCRTDDWYGSRPAGREMSRWPRCRLNSARGSCRQM